MSTNLPTTHGQHWFRETGKEDKQPKLKECPVCGGQAEHDYPYPHVRCKTVGCYVCGPNDDPHGHKWNSIPRRSEVAELLRLVDEACMSGQTTVDMARTQRELMDCARKLRKEWKP